MSDSAPASGAFESAAGAYDRHVGRYAPALAQATVDALELRAGGQALDVGCGTGIGTQVVAAVFGPEQVAGVDPSETFLAVCRDRLPHADLRVGLADALPFEDGRFAAVLSQLLLPFLPGPGVAVTEMRRVAQEHGVVAATVWDTAGGMPMLRAFWDAARAVAPEAVAAANEDKPLPNSTRRELTRLWRGAQLVDVSITQLEATASYQGFDDFWSPFAAGAAASGRLTQSLDAETQGALREEVGRVLGCPTGPFSLTAKAWCVSGRRS